MYPVYDSKTNRKVKPENAFMQQTSEVKQVTVLLVPFAATRV